MPSAWNGRGALLRALGRIEEALASFNRAPGALIPIPGEALQDAQVAAMEDEEEGLSRDWQSLEQAVRLEPTRPALKSNLLHLRIMTALKDCDWASADAIAATLPGLVAAG